MTTSHSDGAPLTYGEIVTAMRVAAGKGDVAELDACRETANSLGSIQLIAELDGEYRRLRDALAR